MYPLLNGSVAARARNAIASARPLPPSVVPPPEADLAVAPRVEDAPCVASGPFSLEDISRVSQVRLTRYPFDAAGREELPDPFDHRGGPYDSFLLQDAGVVRLHDALVGSGALNAGLLNGRELYRLPPYPFKARLGWSIPLPPDVSGWQPRDHCIHFYNKMEALLYERGLVAPHEDADMIRDRIWWMAARMDFLSALYR